MKNYIVTLTLRGLLQVEVPVSTSNRKSARSEALKIARANAGQITPQVFGRAFSSVKFTGTLTFRRENISDVREALNES